MSLGIEWPMSELSKWGSQWVSQIKMGIESETKEWVSQVSESIGESNVQIVKRSKFSVWVR